MLLKIYALKDRATQMFGTPMFLMADGQALRQFSDEINRDKEDNQMFKHPDDFELYSLGDWDTETADFKITRPELISQGKQVKIR